MVANGGYRPDRCHLTTAHWSVAAAPRRRCPAGERRRLRVAAHLEVERGEADKQDNLLKNAPHCLQELLADEWKHPYSRERAAYPTQATREHKIWPPVSRIDDAYGDRNLVCTCPPIEEYASASD